MPTDLWNGAVRIGGCGLIVAAGAIPVAIAARIIARKQGEPLLPKPKRWPVPWTGFELLFLFPFAALAPMSVVDPLLAGGFYQTIYGADAPEASWHPMRPLWAALFFIPFLAACLVLLRTVLYPEWKSAANAKVIPARTALGVEAWFVIHPPVWIVFFIVSALFAILSLAPDEHPLEKSFGEGRPPIDQVLLLVQASVLTPFLEELLFRGLLLPWILGRKYRIALIMGVAVVLAFPLALERGGGEMIIGPAVFALVLLAGWLVLSRRVSSKRRSFGAVYASSSLFAVVHSNIWPTPIPLFVLGLGLGWLALRTRGFLASMIVHGLFNAVSVLFVLRT